MVGARAHNAARTQHKRQIQHELLFHTQVFLYNKPGYIKVINRVLERWVSGGKKEVV